MGFLKSTGTSCVMKYNRLIQIKELASKRSSRQLQYYWLWTISWENKVGSHEIIDRKSLVIFDGLRIWTVSKTCTIKRWQHLENKFFEYFFSKKYNQISYEKHDVFWHFKHCSFFCDIFSQKAPDGSIYAVMWSGRSYLHICWLYIHAMKLCTKYIFIFSRGILPPAKRFSNLLGTTGSSTKDI